MGARIHAILWSRRQTQASLAGELGITATTLSKKLRGTVPLTIDELVRVASFLGVSAAELLDPDEANDPGAVLARGPAVRAVV